MISKKAGVEGAAAPHSVAVRECRAIFEKIFPQLYETRGSASWTFGLACFEAGREYEDEFRKKTLCDSMTCTTCRKYPCECKKKRESKGQVGRDLERLKKAKRLEKEMVRQGARK